MVAFLCEIIRNCRQRSSFTNFEESIWKKLEDGFAHEEKDGSIMADIVVMDGKRKKAVRSAVRSHPLYGKLLLLLQELYDRIAEILKRNNSSIPEKHISYYTTMELFAVRGMAVYDQVESGRLMVPENAGRSTAAMYLEIDT